MPDYDQIDAQARVRLGKGGARSLRRDGRLPAIVYGGEGAPIPISLEHRALTKEYHRPGFFARLYDLQLNGEALRVLPREVQVDPVTDAPLHVDFLRFVKGARLAVAVVVRFTGQDECEGLKRGGVLNIVRHEVELLCPVESIPSALTADIAGLDIGDSVHIGQIELPEGVVPTITDRDFTIATIAAPTVHVEEETEEAAEGEEIEGEEVEGEPGAEEAETPEGEETS